MILLLGLVALSAGAQARSRAEQASTRDVEGQDMDVLRGYGDRAAKTWLKNSLGLDLDELALEWEPGGSVTGGALPSLAGTAAPGSGNGPKLSGPRKPGGDLSGRLSLRLEQSDDLLRLTRDARDVPFGLSLSGELPLSTRLQVLKTTLWVPLSWKDEWRAEASLPVMLGTGPLARRLTLRSDLRSQLGRSQFEAGLGTVWNPGGLGAWNVDYDFNRRFGQGDEEAIHWLRFSKDF
jgi:hypothetical protein